MKCENHPNRIAAQRCGSCNSPLCDQCAIHMDNGSVMCDQCSLLAVLKQKHEKTQDKLLAKREYRLQIAEKRKRQEFLRKTVLYTFVMIVAFASLHVFHRLHIPENEEITLSEHNDIMLYILDQAIHDYIEDYSGELPYRLTDLIGRYLPAEKVTRRTLARFDYEKGIPPAFRLQLRSNVDDPIAGMVMTDEGCELE